MEGSGKEGGGSPRKREVAVQGRTKSPTWLSSTMQTLPLAISLVALVAVGYLLQDHLSSTGTLPGWPTDPPARKELLAEKDELSRLVAQLRLAVGDASAVLERGGAAAGTGTGTGTVAEELKAQLRLAVHKLLPKGGAQEGAVFEGERGKGTEKEYEREKGKEGCDCAEETLQTMLQRAEEQYQENLRHRDALVKFETYVKQPYVNKGHVKANVLAATYPCPGEQRLGLWGEGGKWLCLFHKNVSKNPTVISIGSNGDSSFEEDVNRRLNAFSHTFDFTLNATDKAYISSRPYLKFYDLGLAGKTMVPITYKRFKRWFPKMRVVTVPQMLAATGLKYVDYFKIDCETCEYGVFEDIAKLYTRDTVPFGQLQIEVHKIGGFGKKLVQLVMSLEKLGYRMFHAEVNGYYEEGMEIAFIHERLVEP